MTIDFLSDYLRTPGALSQWIALLCLQSFHSPLLAPIVLFGLALATAMLSLNLMNRVQRSPWNILYSMLPLSLTIVLVNNYNFPFTVIISQAFFLIVMVLLLPGGRVFLSDFCILRWERFWSGMFQEAAF